MFQQVFNALDTVFRQEPGCTTELDYTEQASWLLFLKYLDDLEEAREVEAGLAGRPYRPIIDAAHRWSAWASPRRADGSPDRDRALTGDDLLQFVDRDLWPHLHGFTERAEGPDTIEYKIGEIFGEIRSKFRSGYSLRDALDLVDQLRFGSVAEKHELSELYEAKIARMGNAGRNGGEYYTPRPLIRAIVRLIDPRIGERVYDPACGSAGFLCEAFAYLRPRAARADDLEQLQRRTFLGREKKSLAYVIGVMNMILHGVDAPTIVHANTLAQDVRDIAPSARVDVVLANPPFGGKERAEIQGNFPIRSGETAFLFLQHVIRSLKPGGRAGVVIKNTFLSNTDAAATALRRELLTECNLWAVLDCPAGTFQGAGVKTVVLFFTRGSRTREVWYHQLDPGRSLGKTNALTDADFAEFLGAAPGREPGPRSWRVDVADVDAGTWDLSVRNPHAPAADGPRAPAAILDEIAALDVESAELLAGIRALL